MQNSPSDILLVVLLIILIIEVIVIIILVRVVFRVVVGIVRLGLTNVVAHEVDGAVGLVGCGEGVGRGGLGWNDVNDVEKRKGERRWGGKERKKWEKTGPAHP